MDPHSANNFLMQYNPVPYNIDFKVYIYGKNVEDANKILEQVLPYFTPDWTTAVKLMPEMGLVIDIPVILNHVEYSDNYDKKFAERRAIIYTLDLVVKGYFYGPVKSKPIIKFVDTQFYVSTPASYANLEVQRFANATIANSYARANTANSTVDYRLDPSNIHWIVGHTPKSEYVVTEPGLTANGQPTSNIALSIPVGEIWASNDYGYITEIFHGDGT